MRLSWPEIRARAAVFAKDWKDAHYEIGETQSFYNEFFAIFGVDRKRVAVYEKSVAKLSGTPGRIDLFWPGELLVEQKSRGHDLLGAKIQAMDYTHRLSDAEMPKRLLVCDFQTWMLTDLTTGEEVAFALRDLPKHIDKFGFILGRQTARFKDQDPVNIKAAELVGHLHDKLAASGYTGHKLEVFLTRIVFCLFADDTGIFEPKDILHDWLEGIADPASLGPQLNKLFEVLDTAEDARSTTLSDALRQFPYVNGHLFKEYFPPPDFDEGMRTALLNACRFDWTPISPAIFGSLFQSVMDAKERRAAGAHYTTEKNILKLIGPLFMDDLRAEFAAIRARRTGRQQALRAFHDKLASLTFFDPACGCGNFLVITYREIRQLELELLLELRSDGQLQLDASVLSRVDVDQFYGIEIGEFPARIAETALWMMDHLMNLALSTAFGGYYPRIPLKKAPTIRYGDALEVDWAEVLPPERCSFVLGNPPFVGQSYQSPKQREQMRELMNPKGATGTPLDYVGAWFLKAGAYVQGRTRISFVATNSITQGEQVALLWPVLFDRYGLEIAFAHRTFAWGSDARGKAHVHVVIIGLDRRDNARSSCRLFSYDDLDGDPIETVHRMISPYLFDASLLGNPHLVVQDVPKPINHLPEARMGTKPVVGDHYIFSAKERADFEAMEPGAARFFRPFIGSREFINGIDRFILHLEDASPNELANMPLVRERILQVRRMRSKSRKAATVRLADYPTRYEVSTVPTKSFLVLPSVSSERRPYAPIGWLEPPVIPSNLVQIVPDAELSTFALLTSAMHMSWLRHIGGRLKSDFRYTIGLVYNTFPLPPGADLAKLDPLAQAVLDARAAHPGATLADLYDPDLMPADLRAAHGRLDRAVDRLYRAKPFSGDRERVEHLFALYEAMAAPLLPAPPRVRRRAGR
ncbi:DNA methyltransferase [Neotabrizicola shimadae]|uniref:site-specific DNA-methyltransferase (adenine-specific) n=1 Tax=Neotabrizicola shimadae TaxID=2807096 RepID=A0A8G0ZU04_9RHOB|nr:DNA methyltransferase [Neotabrizicola shimadae]QYZ68625.1 class I SAM-dependent DNA methyltransferase [Neotabrizicola shimadae]